MTDLDTAALDGIAARAEAATPGPWHAFTRGPISCAEVWRSDPSAPDTGSPESDGLTVSDALTDADAEFIAAARSDVPALLAEVRRLRDDVARVREVAAERQNRAAAYRTAATERGMTIGQQWALQQNAAALDRDAAEILAALDGTAAAGGEQA